MDVKALFTNIRHKDGLEAMKDNLNLREEKKVPTDFLISLMEIILKHNIFEFDESYFKQEVGAAMGSKPVPSYANMFMAKIDKLIKEQQGAEAIILMKRFLDDFFFIFKGSTKELHALFEKLNTIHPTIQLTMNHTYIENEPSEQKCDCTVNMSVPFLDVTCSIVNGRIETDLYKKETDRNQYLLPSSCHPKNTTKSIPFSLALRVVRVCSTPKTRDIILRELKYSLMERGYNEEMLEASIEKARSIPRDRALKKAKPKNKAHRTVFAVPFDPRLPAISSTMARHWRSMTSHDSYLQQVFKEPPLIAFKRQNNIRNFLVRAKVPNKTSSYPKRFLKGMKRCGTSCTACPYIKEGNIVKINNKNWNINRKLNCDSYNVVYAIICKKDKCNLVYIGETKRMLKHRLTEHRG